MTKYEDTKPCPTCKGTGSSPIPFHKYPHPRCPVCHGWGRVDKEPGDQHGGTVMFSIREKRIISQKIQEAIKATKHPELPEGEVTFEIRIEGATGWSWAVIKNNGAVENPGINANPHNEAMDQGES